MGVQPGQPYEGSREDGRGDLNREVYETIVIGSQIWMAENMKLRLEGSKCYDNDNSNCEDYGALYDWETAMTACPNVDGWRLPSSDDWATLIDYVGGTQFAGYKLKAATRWGNGSGEDKFGFAAFPGGYCAKGATNDYCDWKDEWGIWWSSTPLRGDNSKAYTRIMVSRDILDKGEVAIAQNSSWELAENKSNYFLSVRCVKDK